MDSKWLLAFSFVSVRIGPIGNGLSRTREEFFSMSTRYHKALKSTPTSSIYMEHSGEIKSKQNNQNQNQNQQSKSEATGAILESISKTDQPISETNPYVRPLSMIIGLNSHSFIV